MARIELVRGVLEDFERILDHLVRHEAVDPSGRLLEILEAIRILARNPLIGRPVRGGARELVIGQGAHGYLALYRHVAAIDTVFVLALRSQREAGDARDA